MNDEKVALYAQISKQVIEYFNTYLFEEFGTTFGNRSNEIEKAIKLYIKVQSKKKKKEAE